MPWHTKNLLRSTSSQEQVEEFSLTSYLDTLQLELAKSNPTQETSCSKDKLKDSSQSSQSGMMSRQWMVAPGGEQLTFFAEDSPVKTSVQQTLEVKALQEVAQDFGRSMRDWLKKCSLALSSQKTPLCCEVKDLEPSSKTWPRWGIMQGGVLLELGTSLTALTGETECGYWPTATTDTSLRKKKYSQGGTPLSLAVQHSHWLTPTCFDGTKATKRWREDFQNGLVAQVYNPDHWPTPLSRDHKGGSAPQGLTRKDGKSRMDNLPNVVAYGGLSTRQMNQLNQSSSRKTTQLNPSWVEWLMGWPIGWTDLKPLEMDKYHNVQLWHGKPYQ